MFKYSTLFTQWNLGEVIKSVDYVILHFARCLFTICCSFCAFFVHMLYVLTLFLYNNLQIAVLVSFQGVLLYNQPIIHQTWRTMKSLLLWVLLVLLFPLFKNSRLKTYKGFAAREIYYCMFSLTEWYIKDKCFIFFNVLDIMGESFFQVFF